MTDGDQFRLMVLAAPRTVEVVIQRPGDAEPQLVQLTLPGSPVRLGFSWDQDRAASSMVMLTRVVPGSAAEQAGLAARDRVYQVDGREFTDGQEFGRLVTSATGPVSLLVERQGVLHTFIVRPLDLVATDAPSALDVHDTATQQPNGAGPATVGGRP